MKEILTDSKVEECVQEIISAVESSTKEDFQISFQIINGKMTFEPIENEQLKEAIIKLHGREIQKPNTSLSFDSRKNSLLEYIIQTMNQKFESNSHSEEDLSNLSSFIKQVINKFNSDSDVLKRLRDVVRRNVLNSEDDVLFPLNDCVLFLFEFGDKADYGDTISVKKYSLVNVNTGKVTSITQSISEDIMRRRRSFGYTKECNTKEIYTQIINEQKAANNPLYAEILPEDIKIVEEAKECHLDFFIDYSPISKEDLLKRLEANEALKKENESTDLSSVQ